MNNGIDETTLETVALGFDVRKSLDDPSDWTEDRRFSFLIRPDVRRPLSVDRDVWPSVAESPDENPVNLWNSVTEIILRVPGITLEPQDASVPVVVGIEAVVDRESSHDWRDLFLGYLQPEEKSVELSFDEFGYDVADRYLVSGLSNCGLSPEELATARKEWAPRINAFGLFSKVTDACGFRKACDGLVVEHAPFSVYRITRTRIRIHSSVPREGAAN